MVRRGKSLEPSVIQRWKVRNEAKQLLSVQKNFVLTTYSRGTKIEPPERVAEVVAQMEAASIEAENGNLPHNEVHLSSFLFS